MPRREFNLSNLDGLNGFAINGVSAGDWSGTGAASAGDVNADGITDVIIGAHYADPGGRSDAGQSYVVFGHGDTWASALELSTLHGVTGVMINGIAAGDFSGIFVAAVGDVNADGIDDVIIGANQADVGNRSGAGQSFLVFGHNGSWPSILELSLLDGTTGVIINGIAEHDSSGYYVASAGDVNGDGIADVIIGAYAASPGGRFQAGQSYLIFGHADTWPTTLELSSLNGTTGVIINGITTGDWSGHPVASAGDVNGDGFDDVIIGAVLANPGGRENAGQSYVVFGHNGAWPTNLELSSLNGTTGVLINGIVAGDGSGQSVASADINGDGINDVIIGAHGAGPGGRGGAGQTYLVFGHNGSWPASLELSSLNGITGVFINGITAGDQSGNSVAPVGDVNGDGIDDVIIGAYLADPGSRVEAGQSYVVFGRYGVWPTTLELSSLNGIAGVIVNGIESNDRSGRPVASASDINGDGFADVIIGAYWADPGGRTDAGQSYVIFGGAEQFSVNQITIQSGQMIRLTQENLAVDPVIGNRTFTVSNVSHVNFVSTYNTSETLSNFTQQQINDGEILVIHDGSREVPSYTVSAEGITRIFSDVHPQAANVSFSIGAPRISAPHREFNLSDLNGVNGFTINGIAGGDGIADGDGSGWSVSSAGDVNGDEVDDVIIGAVLADPNGQTNAGESYVVFGHQGSWAASFAFSSLNGSNGVVLQGIDANDNSGISVASAGDLNGDGVDDVIIGANSVDRNGQRNIGESYVVFGHQGSWPASLALSSLNGSNGVVLRGIAVVDNSGRSVAFAGDVNGDGVDDVIIGAYLADPNGQNGAGESYVVFGRRGSWPASLALSSLNGSNGVVLRGIAVGDNSGRSVAFAGDVNGDGVDDVIIGAWNADCNAQTDAGESYVVFGHRGQWPASLALSSLNGANGVVLQGITAYDYSGWSVASAGDFNGDGIDDVIIGAYRPNSDAGESYVIFGHGGSWPASLALSSLNGSNGVVLRGIAVADYSGRSVAFAGDVNGDGVDDVVIGANGADPNGQYAAGESYVVFGNRGVWPAVFDLVLLDKSFGVTLNGISANDESGYRVSSAGDINNDGFDDVIIGAYRADPNNQTNAGASYVIFGGAEQFSANEIEVQQGEAVLLNASNIEIAPNIDSRIINVTDVSHGHFALTSNHSTAINSFNQSQINNGHIVFVHDGSDQAPSYTVSAEGITRVFSNVHPQQANVSFVLSTSTTTSSVSSTITDTTNTQTSTTDTVTSVAPTAVPTVNPSSFFGAPTNAPTPQLNSASSSPTAQINNGDETTTQNSGGGSDSTALIVGVMGGVIGIMALIIAGFVYQRRNEREKQKAILAREAEGARGPQTTAMTENPLFVAGSNRTNVFGENAGYLTVGGAEIDYEIPVPDSERRVVLDDDQYVVRPGESTTDPTQTYSIFRSPNSNRDGGVTTSKGPANEPGAYEVFRSAR